jgi:hypothetical protein
MRTQWQRTRVAATHWLTKKKKKKWKHRFTNQREKQAIPIFSLLMLIQFKLHQHGTWAESRHMQLKRTARLLLNFAMNRESYGLNSVEFPFRLSHSDMDIQTHRYSHMC